MHLARTFCEPQHFAGRLGSANLCHGPSKVAAKCVPWCLDSKAHLERAKSFDSDCALVLLHLQS